jgi:Flp pilus assembly CpaE family ATPase
MPKSKSERDYEDLVRAGGREQRLKAIFDARESGRSAQAVDDARELDSEAAEGAVTPVNDTVVGAATPDYDPANASVADVLAFVEAHPDAASTVLAMEQAGKGRVGIVKALTKSQAD